MSTAPFKSIALLGATGNVGSRILAALHSANFTVTAIQRPDSTGIVSPPTKVQKVDFTSGSALTEAFKNQDVVISALPNPRLASDKIWIDAAIAAGVKRIVPSEFSTNLETDLSRKLPIVVDKVEVRKYVEGVAAAGKIEWTSVNNGPFFIGGLWTKGFMGPNAQNKFTTLHDGGERVVSTTTLERIGEAVARVLMPEYTVKTRNTPVYVYSTLMSERRMTGLVAKAVGSDVGDFKVNDVEIETVTKDAFAAFEKGDKSKMFSFYIPFCYGKGYGGDFSSMGWNEKLNLKEMSEKELEETVKEWV